MSIASAIADTEERIARTLQDLGTLGDQRMSERRLQLAREAAVGAVTAAKHGERLQQLAERSAEQAEIAALQSLLHHAGTVLTELARTEQAIAAALDRLAHFDDQQAGQRLTESTQAARAAQRALQRAEQLHRIETGPPKTGPPKSTPPDNPRKGRPPKGPTDDEPKR